MKRYLKIFLCLVLVVSLTGCAFNFNKKDSESQENNNTEQIETGGGENNQGDELSDDTTDNTSSKELVDFVKLTRSNVQAISNDTAKVDLISRNNSLVYVYTYNKTYASSEVQVMKETLETSINNEISTFENVLSSVKAVAPETKSVIIEYYNGDNTLITSIEVK